MKVRATSKGYYGGTIREVGEEFVIEAGSKLGLWMEPADSEEVYKPAPIRRGKSAAVGAKPEPVEEQVM